MVLLLLDHMMPIRLDFLKAVNDSYPVAGMITLSPLGKHTVQYKTAKNIY